MLQVSLTKHLIPFLIGVVLSGGVVHLLWSNYNKDRETRIAQDWAKNLESVNKQLEESREARERERGEFLAKLEEKEGAISQLESDVDAGAVRLRIATRNCVPASGTDASGTGEGTAELAPSARQDYFALVRGMEEQYELLQLCRATLKRRSANGTR